MNRCKPHGDLRALSTEGFHRQGEPGKGMRGWRRFLAISHMGLALATGKSLQDVGVVIGRRAGWAANAAGGGSNTMWSTYCSSVVDQLGGHLMLETTGRAAAPARKGDLQVQTLLQMTSSSVAGGEPLAVAKKADLGEDPAQCVFGKGFVRYL